MNEKEIKLSTRPEPVAQPQFPFMNIQIAAQGIIVTTHFTPVSAFTQVLDPDTVEKILPHLREMVKNKHNELALIQHINSSKIN